MVKGPSTSFERAAVVGMEATKRTALVKEQKEGRISLRVGLLAGRNRLM